MNEFQARFMLKIHFIVYSVVLIIRFDGTLDVEIFADRNFVDESFREVFMFRGRKLSRMSQDWQAVGSLGTISMRAANRVVQRTDWRNTEFALKFRLGDLALHHQI